MKTFNRVVTVIGLIIWFLLLPIVAAIPDRLLRWVQDLTFSAAPWFGSTGGRLITAVVAILLWLVTLWLLWMELRRARSKQITVSAAEGGTAQVSAESVARLLELELSMIPDVAEVTASVDQGRDGVLAEVELTTVPGVSVPAVTNATISKAQDTLQNNIGAKVAKVNVKVRQVGMGSPRQMATAPVTPAPVPSTPEPELPTPAWARPVAEEETPMPVLPTLPAAPEPVEEREDRPAWLDLDSDESVEEPVVVEPEAGSDWVVEEQEMEVTTSEPETPALAWDGGVTEGDSEPDEDEDDLTDGEHSAT